MRGVANVVDDELDSDRGDRRDAWIEDNDIESHTVLYGARDASCEGALVLAVIDSGACGNRNGCPR